MNTIIEWNNVLLEAIRKIGGAPCPIARAGAMMHIAMYDVVNLLTSPPIYRAYLSVLPIPDPNTSVEAAAVYAAYQVLSKVYPSRINDFNAALDTSLSQIQDSAAEINRGRILGIAVGDLVVSRRMNDGSEIPSFYLPGNQPGDWRPTDATPAVTPQWPNVAPFSTSGDLLQFRPPLPGGYTNKLEMLRSAEYAAQFNDVKRLGSANSTVRTDEQTEIAFFWANDVDGTYKPPGHLYRITQIVAQQRLLSLLETARLFALVGIALADAGIVSWDAKYSTDIDLWRPETAIRLADTDGNLFTESDQNWQPLSVDQKGQHFSPAFPAYISGHATFGAAHAGIMRKFFGTDNVTFSADTDDPNPIVDGVKRTFNSFTEAALENARSRIYLGVHFQWDADHGFLSGSALAEFVFESVLQRLP